uniref:BED-type domain-containing protein n=1 Tax=Plectus sambesii TaxID=2011161 RepID=A0A914VK96_9BILA
MEELDSSEDGSGPNCIAAEYLIRMTSDANFERSQPRGYGRKALVWNYFKCERVANKTTCLQSECDYWNKGANTTTLVHHLKRHKRDFEEYLPMKKRYDEERQNREEDAAKRSKPISLNISQMKKADMWSLEDKRQTTLEKKLAALFGATHLLLNFINNLFFREFITTAQPCFTLPSSRAKVRDLIFELHEETVISVKHHLRGAQKVAVILDLWTQASYKYENGIGSDDDKDEDGEVIENSLTKHTSHPGDPNLDLSYDKELIIQEIESDEVEEVNFSRVFPLRLDCYSHHLMRLLANVVDRDPQTRELQKKVFAMVQKFKSKSTALQALVA